MMEWAASLQRIGSLELDRCGNNRSRVTHFGSSSNGRFLNKHVIEDLLQLGMVAT
jgi:hypothetical protein